MRKLFNKKTIYLILILFFVGVICITNAILGIAILGLFLMNLYFLFCYKKKVPNIFNNCNRDYEMLFIGSSYLIDNKKILNCCAYNRSLEMDFEILKRLYSFLSKNGEVCISYNFKYDKLKGINPNDIYYLHSVTMEELNISNQKVRYYLPFFISPMYSLKFWRWEKGKKIYEKEKNNDIQELQNYLIQIGEFVTEREIRTHIFINGIEEGEYSKINNNTKFLSCTMRGSIQ